MTERTEQATILAVDDTSESLALLVTTLSSAGYRVRPADSGELALAAVAASRPDLILLDVRMRGIDGLEVCRRLKANEETRRIPIILVSAFADVTEWAEGLRLGASDYVTKPFQPAELLTRVGTHLALYRAESLLERQGVEIRRTHDQLQAELGERRRVADQLLQSLDQAEAAHGAMLNVLEDQQLIAAELRDARDRWKITFDASSDAICLLDESHAIRQCNQAMAALTGRSTDDLVGRQCWEVVHGTSAPIPECPVFRMRTSLRRERMELPLGGRWIDVTVDPILDAQRTLQGVVHNVRDVTERKEAEAEIGSLLSAVQTERDTLAALVNSMTDEVWFADTHARFTLMNASARSEFELDRADAVTVKDLAGALEVLRPDGSVRPIEEAPPLRALAGEVVRDQEELVRTPATGELRFRLVNAAPVRSRDGNVLGAVAVVKDLTERRRTEEALRASEAKLRITLDDAPVCVAAVGLDKRFLNANKAFCTFLGYTEEELKQRSILDVTHPDDVGLGMADMRDVTDGTKKSGIVQKRYVRSDGSVVWGEVTINLVRDARGRPDYLLPVIQDVTLRKEAEAEHARMQAQRMHGQRLESIGTLASGVAHEINNPLNVVMNYAQLILDEGESATSTTRGYATGIVTESERMARIVKNLLAFSRHDKETRSPADVGTLVSSTLSLVSASFRKDRIAMDVEIPEGLPTVDCRTQEIQQVLLNLLTNARDALNERFPEGAPAKRIRIVATPFERDRLAWIRLTVDDQGGGIAPAIAEHVFDPFFTTKRRDKGTGLGLSISYGIVTDHGGKLWFETEPGVSTRFHVELRSNDASSGPGPVQGTSDEEA